MDRISLLVIIVTLSLVSASCSNSDSTPPVVVDTYPATGSVDVDPGLKEISVTFSEPMKDGNWSWAFTKKELFPEMEGQPYYKPGLTTNVLPVKLAPNRSYELWINSAQNKNFKDQAGNPATPFRMVFKTK